MSHGYTFLGQAFPHADQTLITALFVAIIIAVTGISVGCKIKKNVNNYLVPDNKFSIRFVCETLCALLISLSDDVMGKENRKYLPFIATMFIYILCMNLISLVPGFVAATGGIWPDNVVFNFGIAIISFLFYNFLGIRKHGIIGYLKHFFGGPELLKPALLIVGVLVATIELVSNIVRPLTLSIRLYGNITGDHLTLTLVNDLVGKFIVPVFLCYVLGTFVCFVQAFVFSLLSMVYIKLALGDEEHDEHKESEENTEKIIELVRSS